MLSAMELKVVQRNDDRVFGGPYVSDFMFTYAGVEYRVRIEQCLYREIRIASAEKVDIGWLYKAETYIEHLLFLFDGRFFPVDSVVMFDEKENASIYQEKIEGLYKNRLPIYSSIDIARNRNMKLINYKDVDLECAMIEWSRIHEELDIAFNMFLYCMSDIQMPVDCKIASLIEMAKPIAEIIEQKDKTFRVPRKGNSKQIELRAALKEIILKYGAVLFEREGKENIDNILTLMVHTRNRISHVKSRQGEKYLNGTQCVLYIAKLSILYRVIFYKLIGIDEDLYGDRVVKAVDAWNNCYDERIKDTIAQSN